MVLQGSADGSLTILSAANVVLAEASVPEPVVCGCAVVERAVWVGSGCHIYQVVYPSLAVTKIIDNAHEDVVQAMQCTGNGQEVWSCTLRGEVCVWNTRSMQRTGRFALTDSRLHSMCSVEMRGAPAMWIGAMLDWRYKRCYVCPRVAM
jgi:hypothetical protein